MTPLPVVHTHAATGCPCGSRLPPRRCERCGLAWGVCVALGCPTPPAIWQPCDRCGDVAVLAPVRINGVATANICGTCDTDTGGAA